ncbi:hypothetical protein SVAN01_04381 [Stagonosporopsis vannaccii]|nr:hypothetical protein SVAN01_04381 [Stagonosporopsis vannaccii]
MFRRRLTNLTNHDDLSMDAFCVSLAQRIRSETWPTFLSQPQVILLGAAVRVGHMPFNTLCAVVQRSVSAAQPSTMHVEDIPRGDLQLVKPQATTRARKTVNDTPGLIWSRGTSWWWRRGQQQRQQTAGGVPGACVRAPACAAPHKSAAAARRDEQGEGAKGRAGAVLRFKSRMQSAGVRPLMRACWAPKFREGLLEELLAAMGGTGDASSATRRVSSDEAQGRRRAAGRGAVKAAARGRRARHRAKHQGEAPAMQARLFVRCAGRGASSGRRRSTQDTRILDAPPQDTPARRMEPGAARRAAGGGHVQWRRVACLACPRRQQEAFAARALRLLACEMQAQASDRAREGLQVARPSPSSDAGAALPSGVRPLLLRSVAVARSAAARESRAAFLLPAARCPALLCSLSCPLSAATDPACRATPARCTRLYLRHSTIRAVPVPSRLSVSTPDRPCSCPETPAGAKRASPFDPAPIHPFTCHTLPRHRSSLAGLPCSHCRPQR